MKRDTFASILFADIVKFSDRAVDDESRRDVSIRLQEIVRGCVLLQGKERGEDYLTIYTGDGFALVFLGNALDAFLAGLELNRKLETSDIPCRLGLHCGDVSLITDVNDQVNSVGSTVNDASRVMSFGGKGHLLSSKIYRDLIIRHNMEYKDCFHSIGNYQDKNGEVHVLYNVYNDTAGNRDIPRKGRISEKNHQILSPDDSLLASDRHRKIRGRTSTIRDIVSFLKKGYGLAIVTGPPGIGKTEVCRGALKKFIPEARKNNTPVFYTCLAGISDFPRFLANIAETYNAAGKEDPELVAGVVSETGGVLYLDNFEDTLATDGERRKVLDFVSLITREKSLRILASSRRELYGICDKAIPVDRLDSGDAAQLFKDEWERTGRKAGSLDEITEFVINELGCHPLSIILTAAQALRYPSIGKLREAWLKKGTEIAHVDSGQDDEKLRILNTSISLSLDELHTDETRAEKAIRLWNSMLFFPTGMSEQALDYFKESGTFDDDAISLLIDHNLIEYDLEKNTLVMLPPLVRFAESRAMSGQDGFSVQKAVDTVFPYFFSVTKDFHESSDTRRYFEALDRLITETANIYRFVMLLTGLEDRYRDEVLRINECLSEFYFQGSGGAFVQLNYLNAVIDLRKDEISSCMGFDLVKKGYVQMSMGHFDDALESFTRAHTVFGQSNDADGVSNALTRMAEIDLWKGQAYEAIRKFLIVLESFRKLNNEPMLVLVLSNLAMAKRRVGLIDEAREHYEEALEISRRNGNTISIADALIRLADMIFRLGEVELGVRYMLESLAIFRQEKYGLACANCIRCLGEVETKEGRYGEALQHFDEAVKICREFNSALGLVAALSQKGECLVRAREFDRAEPVLHECLEIARKHSLGTYIGAGLVSLGDLVDGKADEKTAVEHYRKAHEVYKSVYHVKGEADALMRLGEHAHRQGHPEQAETYLKEAQMLMDMMQDREGQALVRAYRALVFHKSGDDVTACSLAAEAKHYAQESHFPPVVQKVDEVVKGLKRGV